MPTTEDTKTVNIEWLNEQVRLLSVERDEHLALYNQAIGAITALTHLLNMENQESTVSQEVPTPETTLVVQEPEKK